MTLSPLAPPIGLIDLGLLTRILCHEINNQLANQRGYTGLLLRRGSTGADGQRWLEELARSGQALETLVRSVQTWTRSEAFLDTATTDGSPAWPGDPAIGALAADLAGRGCPLPLAGSVRVLAILASAGGAAATAWRLTSAPEPLPGGAVLGSAVAGVAGLWLALPWLTGAAPLAAWQASADQILPEDGAAADSWQRSLVLGLLRQAGAELFLPEPGQASWQLAMFLPTADTK